jgi:hypothetical protein
MGAGFWLPRRLTVVPPFGWTNPSALYPTNCEERWYHEGCGLAYVPAVAGDVVGDEGRTHQGCSGTPSPRQLFDHVRAIPTGGYGRQAHCSRPHEQPVPHCKLNRCARQRKRHPSTGWRFLLASVSKHSNLNECHNRRLISGSFTSLIAL